MGLLAILGSYFLSNALLERELISSELSNIKSSSAFSFHNIANDRKLVSIMTNQTDRLEDKRDTFEYIKELSGSNMVAVYYWNELSNQINSLYEKNSDYSLSMPYEYINQVNSLNDTSLGVNPIILNSQTNYFPQNYVLLGNTQNIDGIKFGIILVYDLHREYELVRNTSFLACAISIEIIIIMIISLFFILKRTMGVTRELFLASQAVTEGDYSHKIYIKGKDEFSVLAKTFNKMQDVVKKNEQAQKQFVSDVSHELKAPTASLIMASEYIYNAKQSIPKKFHSSINILHTKVFDFKRLLEDLLEISRSDFGVVVLHKEPVNLNELVSKVKDSLKEITIKAGTTIMVQTSNKDYIANVDYIKFSRIITNLLANAIDYSDGKPVIVRISEDEANILIDVVDRGQGIDKEYQDKVFNRFFRLDPSRKRTIGGTGLGLTITKADVEEHGGKLTVDSKLGHGSTFTVSLPKNNIVN